MKHNILLAAVDHPKLFSLMQSIEDWLHPAYQKHFKVFYHQQLFKNEMVVVGENEDEVMDHLVSEMENEIRLEKFAKENSLKIDLIKGDNQKTITTLSTVADLMIIGLKNYDQKNLTDRFIKYLESVRCPILLIPDNTNVECTVVVNDGHKRSVKMMKSFIKMFGSNVRNMPTSLLMAEPDTESQMKEEKVFVGYLKQFFKDIGTQHMYDDTLTSLFKFVQKECKNPFVVLNAQEGMEVIHSRELFETNVFDHPLFIFKE